MRRTYLSILLIFILIIGSSKDVMNHLGYTLNQDFIAEILCINKDVPESTCNGKCHMMKNKEEQEGGEGSSIPSSAENIPNIFYSLSSESINLEDDVMTLEKMSFFNLILINGRDHFSEIFHPPQFG